MQTSKTIPIPVKGRKRLLTKHLSQIRDLPSKEEELKTQPKMVSLDNSPKTPVENKEKLDILIENSKSILLRASSVFPFDLFPDDVIVDVNKLNIIYHEFFFSGVVHSIKISNISGISVEAGPFFATLKIVEKDFNDEPLYIHYLWKSEATRVCQLIEGLMVAREQKVDLSQFKTGELVDKLEQLGKAQGSLN